MGVSGGTIGDFGDRSPPKLDAVLDDAKPKFWTENWQVREALANKVVQETNSQVVTQNVLILVDLQGVYMGLHKWLSKRDFPIDDGLVLSRFATLQILSIFEEIKKRWLAESGASDFDDLLRRIRKVGPGGQIEVERTATYARFNPTFELFYAPVPFERIERQLEKAARIVGAGTAKHQLDLLKSGVVMTDVIKKRDYAAYADFISKLRANPEYAGSHEGFFNFWVGDRGLTTFAEKEVDTRIVIRSMEALFGREVDALCIISSDQDFLPVHAKAAHLGVPSYQADLGKFATPDRVGKGIKDLGESYLPGRFGADWPLKLILEAVTVPGKSQALYALSEEEVGGLCRLHNSMNDRFHVAAHTNPGGSLSISISKPA